MPQGVTRRQILGTIAGGSLVIGTGYASARVLAKRGEVVAKYVIAESSDPDRRSEILEVERDRDGSADVRIHADYSDDFADNPPVSVSTEVAEVLARRFSEVRYHLNHSCGQSDCSVPQVSRKTFNSVPLGEDVELLYHGTHATRIA